MKKKYFAVFLACLILLVSACSGDEVKKSDNQLILGVMPSMDYLPLAVALREIYCETLGLDLKIVKFYSANERDAAFQSGSVDGVVIDYTGAILQKNGGVDLALTSRCDAPFFIIAGPQSGIASLEGLKGASVAVSQNTVIDYCVDMALRSAGLDASDVSKVEINKIPVRFEMVMGGKISATGLPNPLAMMARDGGGRVLGSNADLGLSITGIVFSGKAMKEKSPLIKKMYQAYDHGVDYLADHGPADVADILINDMGFKPELAPHAELPKYTRAALPPAGDLQSAADWLAGRGLVDPKLDVSPLVNGSFLPE